MSQFADFPVRITAIIFLIFIGRKKTCQKFDNLVENSNNNKNCNNVNKVEKGTYKNM